MAADCADRRTAGFGDRGDGGCSRVFAGVRNRENIGYGIMGIQGGTVGFAVSHVCGRSC